MFQFIDVFAQFLELLDEGFFFLPRLVGPARQLVGIIPRGDQRVRGEVQASFPKVRLHCRCFLGCFRLPGQRFELSFQFCGEVAQPVHIGLHGHELALGFVFAAAML